MLPPDIFRTCQKHVYVCLKVFLYKMTMLLPENLLPKTRVKALSAIYIDEWESDIFALKSQLIILIIRGRGFYNNYIFDDIIIN